MGELSFAPTETASVTAEQVARLGNVIRNVAMVPRLIEVGNGTSVFLVAGSFNPNPNVTAWASLRRLRSGTMSINTSLRSLQEVRAQLAAASPSGGGLEAGKPVPQTVLNNSKSSRGSSRYFTISRHVSPRGGFLFCPLRFFELAPVLVRFDHISDSQRSRKRIWG